MMRHNRLRSQRINATIRLVATAGTLLLLAMLLRWDLLDLLTPFLAIPLLGLLYLFCAICGGLSIVCAVRERQQGAIALVPFLLTVTVWLAIWSIPFTKISIDLDFYTRRAAREQVVAEVIAGQLVADSQSHIQLPSWSGLSKGGDVIDIQGAGTNQYVFFYTFRGIVDSYAGFLWVPPTGAPQNYSDARSKKIRSMTGNWYYIH